MSELEQRVNARVERHVLARRGGRVRLSTSHPERRRAAKTRVWDFQARAAINLKVDSAPTPRRHRGISRLGHEVASNVTLGARDYDPTIERWVAKDPIGFIGGSNLYACCSGDPVNFVDPEGREKRTAAYKVWLAGKMMLRFGKTTSLKEALSHLARDQGVYVGTRKEAIDLARQYSRMKGGSGKVVADPGHTQRTTGSRGYDHIHAYDASGERLPGHFFYGTVGALLFAVDIVPDGEFNYLDLFEFANPMFSPVVPENEWCGRPDCA